MNWWDSNLASALVGAIAGAILTAVPTYLLATRASRETLERDRISRNEQQKTATFRALVKLVIVINRIGSLHRHIERAIGEAEKTAPKGLRVWQKVEPITGLSDYNVRFDADDLVAFVAAGEFAYVTDLLQLTESCASLASATRDYTLHRKRLTDLLAERVGGPMEGRLASITLTEAEAAKLEPLSVELETMVTQLRAFAAEDSAKATALGEQFGPKARAALADDTFPNLGQVTPSGSSFRPP